MTLPLISRLAQGRPRKVLALFCTATLVLVFFIITTLKDSVSDWSLSKLPFTLGDSKKKSICSPEEYANGTWIHRPYHTRPHQLSKTYTFTPDGELSAPVDSATAADHLLNMTKFEDIHTFTRYEACASSREYWWHLGADNPKMFDRLPGPTEWEWVPGGRCMGREKGKPDLRDWNTEEVIRELVEGGGWLLVGDSVTENHFFSLSCLLYPHVIAYPDYTKVVGMYDRAWPQHLFLHPNSTILSTLNLPTGFSISSTPLVTFRRVDLLWSKAELESMHKELHPEFYVTANGTQNGFKLFGTEPIWTISPKEYFDIFNKPLPEGNYATLIASTAGHWTIGTLWGYAYPNPYEVSDDPSPVWMYEGLLQFYREVMERWGKDMQEMLDEANTPERPTGGRWSLEKGVDSRRRKKKVLVRAYLPGHEDCHSHRLAWQEVQPFQLDWWNWQEIWRFNKAFGDLLSNQKSYPDVHYLGIDRPARLRPDAHSTADCLHIMSGAGVLEGWSHYIWHFITREV